MATQSDVSPNPEVNLWKSVFLPGIRNFIIGIVAVAAIVFLLAGTFNYWQGWLFVFVFNILISSQGIYLAIKDPELLKRRTEVAPEDESIAQRIFIIVGLLSGVCQIVISALDYRFGWSQVPVLISLLGTGLMVLSFVVYYYVFKVNSYAATSIQTFEGQTVISTGPYAIVRHPKYVGDIMLVVGVPLALGSWWGLAFLVLTVPMLAWRILDEEKLLKQDLPGYSDYTETVRYRLAPYIW